MANLYSTNLRIVGLKEETTPGTAVDLVDADYNIKFVEGDLSSLEVTMADDSRYMNGKLTRDISTAGIVRSGLTLKSNVAMGEWIATGDDTSPTYTSKFPMKKALGMAGLTTVDVEPTGLDDDSDRGYFEIYSTKSSLCKTMTGELLDVQSCTAAGSKGIAYKLKGLTSNLTVSADEAGAPFAWNFEAKGGVDSVSEKTVIPSFDEDGANNTRNIAFLNTDIILTPVNQDGSTIPSAQDITFCVSSFSVDLQNNISEIICASSEFGLSQTVITDRDPQLTIGVALKALSDFNYWEALNEESIYKVEVVTWEDANKTIPMFKIEIARGQILSANNTDDNGFRKLETTFRALTNTQGATETDKQKDIVFKVYGKTIDQTS